MAINDSTSAASIIQTVVSNIVQETLLQESVAIPTVMDVSSQLVPGMGTLEIPRFLALAPQTVTEGTLLNSQVATIAVDVLNVSLNQAIFWSISDRANIQSKINMAVQLVKDGAKNMAVSIDNAIIGQLLLASAAAPDNRVQFANTPTDTIQVTDITEARRLLNVQNVPMADRFLLLPPSQEKAMLNLSDFIDTSKYGNSEAIQNGEIGKVFGFKVILTTSPSLASASFLAYHRSAVAYGSQINVKFETFRNIQMLADDYTLSMLYGTTVLDTGKRQVLFNSTGT